jgi:hypothetical protein
MNSECVQNAMTIYKLNIDTCCQLYENFLNKFAFWFQVKLSAQIGGYFWDREDMTLLKHYALNYDFDPKKRIFVKGAPSPRITVDYENCSDI